MSRVAASESLKLLLSVCSPYANASLKRVLSNARAKLNRDVSGRPEVELAGQHITCRYYYLADAVKSRLIGHSNDR